MREAPAPTTIAAVVLVLLVSAEKADEPPPDMVLQPKPVPVVQIRAFVAPEQDGIANPDGVVAVNAPRTVFAVCVASWAFVACPLISVNAGCAAVNKPDVEV